MKYKVEFTLNTHSRYGTYIYAHRETVEAKSAAEAREIIRQQNGNYATNGHKKLRITAVTEIH